MSRVCVVVPGDSTEARFDLEDIKITDNSDPFCISSGNDKYHSCIDKLPLLCALPFFPAKYTCLCI